MCVCVCVTASASREFRHVCVCVRSKEVLAERLGMDRPDTEPTFSLYASLPLCDRAAVQGFADVVRSLATDSSMIVEDATRRFGVGRVLGVGQVAFACEAGKISATPRLRRWRRRLVFSRRWLGSVRPDATSLARNIVSEFVCQVPGHEQRLGCVTLHQQRILHRRAMTTRGT